MKVNIGDHIHYEGLFDAIIVSREDTHYRARVTKNFSDWIVGNLVPTAWQSELDGGRITIINRKPELTNYNFIAKNKRRMTCLISKTSTDLK